MEISRVMISGVATNCYFLTNDKTKETVVVDPGGKPEKIVAHIEEGCLRPVAIMLTHGHFDHICAVNQLKEKYDIPIYAGINEKNVLNDGEINLSARYTQSYVTEADVYLSDGEELELANIRMKVLATPGHTSGSVCYLLPDDKALISGDTLFEGAVGRTDFPTGSDLDMRRSISEKLGALPDDIIVYPGHGRGTTIGRERQSNPLF